MRVINRNKRVLLEVTNATAAGIDSKGLFGVLYRYQGDGMMGWVDIVQLHRTIESIKVDSPSAQVEGLLPEPVIIPNPNLANLETLKTWRQPNV